MLLTTFANSALEMTLDNPASINKLAKQTHLLNEILNKLLLNAQALASSALFLENMSENFKEQALFLPLVDLYTAFIIQHPHQHH